ncbi:MAG: outer membrane protein [Beijerinckiaceae bacterium]
MKTNSDFYLAVIAAAMIILPTGAYSADPAGLNRRAPASPFPAKTRDWSGAYVGVHGGFLGSGFKTKTASPNIPALNVTTPLTGAVNNRNRRGRSVNSGGGGVQAGYNFQTGNIVYGVEAETTFTGGGKKKSTTNLTVEQNNRSALKGKLGYSFGSTLLYATAGVAVASARYNSPAVGLTRAGRKSVTNVGPLVGIGVEQMLTENLSLKGEVEVSSFGNKRLILPAGTTNVESGQVAAKVGLNYRF